VFVVVPSPMGRDSLHSKVVSNIQEINARGARTIVIAEEGDDEVVPYATEVIRVPQTPTLLAPLVTVVPAAGLRLRARDAPRGSTSTSRATWRSPSTVE
jgi:glucosamine 6-phosphate synthetase-like amidotransferase/phosphosugar isomerase protein